MVLIVLIGPKCVLIRSDERKLARDADLKRNSHSEVLSSSEGGVAVDEPSSTSDTTETYEADMCDLYASLLVFFCACPEKSGPFYDRLVVLCPTVADILTRDVLHCAACSSHDLECLGGVLGVVVREVARRPESMNAVYGIILDLDDHPEDEGQAFARFISSPDGVWLAETGDHYAFADSH